MLFYTEGRSVLRTALLFCTAVSAFGQPDALAQKSQQAKQLMAQGRFADAVPIYQELCRALPSNTGLRLNLALAYQMSGHHQESIPEFDKVLKADPKNLPALLSLGAAYLAVNEPAKASRSTRFVGFNRLTLNRGECSRARFLRSDGPRTQQYITESSRRCRPGSQRLARPRSELRGARTGRISATQQIRSRLTRVACAYRRFAHGTAAVPQRILFSIRKRLRHKPDFSALHESLAEVYRRSGHADWAEAEEKKVQRPDCAASKQACDFNGGRFLTAAAGPSLYWRIRSYNELALRAFKQLGQLPASVELHAIKAEILSNHGQHLEAANEWRAAQKLAPGDPRIEGRLATSLYEGANYAEAAPLLQKLLKQETDSAELNFFLGDSLLRMEQPEKAVTYLEAAVRLDPKLLPAHASLGLTYIRLGRDADAIPQLNSAREADEDGSIHIQLSRAYQRAGNADASKQMMAEYTRIQQRSESEQRNLEEKASITAP